MFTGVLDKIKEYEHIVLYRHVNPDYDAFGSQFGMFDILQTSFPDKKIYLAGDFTSDLVMKYDVPIDTIVPDFEVQKVLGIILDTANHERIDGDSYQQCDATIKIDHHIVVDSYGTMNVVDSSASSTSQLVGQFLMENELKIQEAGANALYMGIIGDTNRFMYKTTDQRTFKVAALLIDKGINIDMLYQRMYLKKAKDLEINRYILNQYQVQGKVAYYMLKQNDLDALGISRERGSDYVNMLSGIEEFEVWMAITENSKDQNWRVSIRSRSVEIQEVAKKYRGGGHALASGCSLLSIDELPELLQDLEERINAELV